MDPAKAIVDPLLSLAEGAYTAAGIDAVAIISRCLKPSPTRMILTLKRRRKDLSEEQQKLHSIRHRQNAGEIRI